MSYLLTSHCLSFLFCLSTNSIPKIKALNKESYSGYLRPNSYFISGPRLSCSCKVYNLWLCAVRQNCFNTFLVRTEKLIFQHNCVLKKLITPTPFFTVLTQPFYASLKRYIFLMYLWNNLHNGECRVFLGD